MKIADKLNQYPVIEALIISAVLFTAIFIAAYFYPALNNTISRPLIP